MGSTSMDEVHLRLINSDKTCLVLDGGFSTSLTDVGLTEGESWSSTTNLQDPHVREKVEQVYHRFLQSGADIVMANTYHVAYKCDVNEGLVEQWMNDNIDVANKCIDDHLLMYKNVSGTNKFRPLLAVPIGSFASTINCRATTANREQHENDDYRRRLGYGYKKSELQHYFNVRLADPILQHIVTQKVAALGIETVGDLLEVQIVCEILQTKNDFFAKNNIFVWVSLTCLTDEIVDTGSSIDSCVEELAKCPQVTGIGVNCTQPIFINNIVKRIKKVLIKFERKNVLIIVYPNSGETYLSRALKEGETNHWKKTDSNKNWNFADAALEWIENGAHIVGGCCRIGANEIADLVQELDKIKHQLKKAK